MALFLAFVALGGQGPRWVAPAYVARTLGAAALLWIFRRHYTRINWQYWPLGALVGVLGIFQWVGQEKFLAHLAATADGWRHAFPGAAVLAAYLQHYTAVGTIYDPTQQLSPGLWLWGFILIRWLGPTLVVPFMEELFWRDWLWRELISPNDFRLAHVGEWDRRAFWIVAAAFASVHPQYLTAIVWGLMIGLLLLRTKSLGACIVAHGVTNFLLGAYVLLWRDWAFW